MQRLRDRLQVYYDRSSKKLHHLFTTYNEKHIANDFLRIVSKILQLLFVHTRGKLFIFKVVYIGVFNNENIHCYCSIIVHFNFSLTYRVSQKTREY